MCVQKGEFQYVSPNTELALFSHSINKTVLPDTIVWNIYSGLINSSSEFPTWTLFTKMDEYRDIWFFGK